MAEQETLTGRRTPAELSIDTKLLYETLITVEPGKTIEYSVLTDVIKRDVQDSARGNLQSARRMARREHRIVFDVVRCVGLKRLVDSEIHTMGERSRRHIQHTVRDCMKTLACADQSKLSDSEKKELYAAMSYHGAMVLASRPKVLTNVKEAISNGILPSAETMKLLEK